VYRDRCIGSVGSRGICKLYALAKMYVSTVDSTKIMPADMVSKTLPKSLKSISEMDVRANGSGSDMAMVNINVNGGMAINHNLPLTIRGMDRRIAHTIIPT
jgi:hypothetical protein